jgi:TonB family protein
MGMITILALAVVGFSVFQTTAPPLPRRAAPTVFRASTPQPCQSETDLDTPGDVRDLIREFRSHKSDGEKWTDTVGVVTSRSASSISIRILHQKPEPIIHPAPEFPDSAKQTGGLGMLSATVNKEGHVTSVGVSCADALLTQPAVEAVQKWEFKPILVDDQPVEFIAHLEFSLPKPTEQGKL